jgi:hypothetical protein
MPIPEASSGGGAKYPWKDLEVPSGDDDWNGEGDSFKIPASELVGKCANYSPTPPLVLQKTGYKISVRKDKVTGDMRVFRVA